MTVIAGRVSQLEAMLARNERERRKYWPVPMVGGAGGALPSSFLLRITNTGQQLYTGALGTIRGISYSATTLTILPAATPTTGNTYTAGLGGGYLYNADGSLGAEVWVANQPVGAFTPGMTIPLPERTTIVSLNRVILSYGGGSAYVYLPNTA